MASGGGAQRDREAEQRQIELEERRLAAEREAAQFRIEERRLLQEQLTQQNQINEQNVSLLRDLSNQSIQAEQQFASLLEQSTAFARRQTLQQESERNRARAAEQNQRRQTLGISNTAAVPTQQRTSIFSPTEQLSLLSAFGGI